MLVVGCIVLGRATVARLFGAARPRHPCIAQSARATPPEPNTQLPQSQSGLLRAGGLGNVQVVDRQTDRQTVASRLIDGEHVAPGVGTPIGGGGAGRRAPVSSL